MSSMVIVLTGLLTIPANTHFPSIPTSSDTIRVEYSGEADLTDDGVLESVSATAEGLAWDELQVRLEIRDATGNLLFADEWSSGDWCGGSGFYSREGTVEEWVRNELVELTDPDYFMPSGAHGGRFGGGYNNRREMRYGVRMDLYEQLWREAHDIPFHEHLTQQHSSNTIIDEFRDRISQEEVEEILDEISDGPVFIYSPHFDGMFGVAWIQSKGRFAIVLYPG